jgi:hypothetical protein
VIFIEEGPKEAKTFTDETSPRKPAPADRKVSIHGQVIKELPFNWFHDLNKLYPGEKPETKSVRILEEFHLLPSEFRDRIWAGMKRVKINIVDSLPYQVNYRRIIEGIMKEDKTYKMLLLDAKKGDEFAKWVARRMDEVVCEWVIQDSPPERLKKELQPEYWPGSLAFYIHKDNPYREEEIDLTPFKSKRKSMTSTAVKYASKSGSVFNPARDQINPIMRNLHGSMTHYMVRETLRDSHAFDEGDNPSIEWVDKQRKAISGRGPYAHLEYVDDTGLWEDSTEWQNSETYEVFAYGKLHSISSNKSMYVQAADIAAGFARQDYERHGISAVAGRFEYVTINGERITQENAEERFEFWRQIGEQEKRKNQALVILN